MKTQAQAPRTCSHCGREIRGDKYVEKESGVYLGEECYFRDTYLDGIMKGIEPSYLATIEAFVSAIDAREHGTGGHSVRVTRFAVILGHHYGLRGGDLTDLYCGALLHDVGKIGIPDAILLKEGPLTDAEAQTMQRHPEIGYGIVRHIGYLAKASEIIRSHHEHFDGTGYPRGLKGTEIPLGARIFAVADVLDALTVDRPYRRALSYAEALAEIEKASGTDFDPAIVNLLIRRRKEMEDFLGKETPQFRTCHASRVEIPEDIPEEGR